MENNFLAIDKKYFGSGLNSLDLLIVAHIEEFQRNGCECYITNEQFCDMFGENINAVKRSIKKLEDMKLVVRHTTFVSGNGRANRQRTLSINKKWKAHIEPTKIMEGSKSCDGRLKSGEWKAHNEPIKDNKKIIKDNEESSTISPEEKETIVVEEPISPEVETPSLGRRIRDLSPMEADEIKAKLRAGVRYLDIEKEYRMQRGMITSKFDENWRAFLVARANGKV